MIKPELIEAGGDHTGDKKAHACRPQDKRRAKYELLYTERTLLTDDAAFQCIKIREDGEGVKGVFLHKNDVISSAAAAIKATLTKLGPLILPLSELVRPCSQGCML